MYISHVLISSLSSSERLKLDTFPIKVLGCKAGFRNLIGLLSTVFRHFFTFSRWNMRRPGRSYFDTKVLRGHGFNPHSRIPNPCPTVVHLLSSLSTYAAVLFLVEIGSAHDRTITKTGWALRLPTWPCVTCLCARTCLQTLHALM